MEIPISAINSKVADSGNLVAVNSCGRLNSPTGTEGHIDITDGNIRIAEIYWDCPWGHRNNTVEVRSVDSRYSVTLGPWERFNAIGNVDVVVKRLN